MQTTHRYSVPCLVGAALFVVSGFALSEPVAAGPAGAAPRLTLAPCQVEGVSGEARCGTYEVWEDRAAKAGRKIPLKVVLLPATGASHQPDPLIYFAGGPGDTATGGAGGLAHDLAKLRASRDILLVDVRGTGGSQPLICEEMASSRGVQKFFDDFMPVDAVTACRRQYESKVDLRHYTSAEAMDDVAEVMDALGIAQANLFGASYGTRAAQTFARRHPGKTRTMVLEGVVPNDSRYPLASARDAQAALDGLFAECAGDPACHAAFPDPAQDFVKVLARVRREPVTVPLTDPKSGAPAPLRLNENGVGQTIRYMLYVPTTAVAIPLYLHLAAQGNFQPLGETAYFFGSNLTQMADGFYLSVTCAEDVAFIDPKAVPAAVAGTFLGEFRIDRQRAACAAWPAKKLGAEILQPLRSPVPTLLISGERDPTTPATDGAAVAKNLPNSAHVVVPDGSHGSEGMGGVECLGELMATVIERGSVAGLDTACVGRITRPPFVLALEATGGVELSEAAVRPFVGVYADPQQGLEIPVTFADGHLKMRAPNGDVLILAPTSATRFAIRGAPPGFMLEFQRDAAGKVTGLVLEQGPANKSTLVRQP